jgi:5-methylcytosine-specific restriction endonuclease McrA
MADSKLWEAAYKSFSDQQNRYKAYGRKTKKLKIKPTSRKNGPVSIPKDHWIKTFREMREWQKTDSFVKWSRKQFLKQGGTCYYCDTPLKGMRQNVEHIVPKSKGGTNHKSNLVLACSYCNKEKNTKLLSQSEKKALKLKNSKKKGTYHQIMNKEEFMSDEEFTYVLAERLRED